MRAFLTICRPRHRHEKIERERLCSEAVYSEKRAGESGKPENGGTPKAVTGPGTPEETGR